MFNDLSEIQFIASVLTYLAIIVNIIAIIVCPIMADKKSRSVGGWIVAGIFLSWIAIIILACLSDKTPPRHSNPGTFSQYLSNKNSQKKYCPNCGSYATNNKAVCDMCGSQLNASSTRTTGPQKSRSATYSSKPAPKTIPIPKVEKYHCDSCGELIDTIQCPWCGKRKK